MCLKQPGKTEYFGCKGEWAYGIHTELKMTVGNRPFSDQFQGFGRANPIC